MAFWTTFSQDGCDYAKLEGPSVASVSGSDVIPYVEVGRSDFRAPLYYAEPAEWGMVYTEECTPYPDSVNQDAAWGASKWLVFISAVIGGALALFLWFIVCFTISKRTWRVCAAVSVFTALLRVGSFFFFLTDICVSDGSNCVLDFGSRMDIIAIVLWIVSAFCMVGYYPKPKLRRLTDDELTEELEREMAQTTAGSEDDGETMSLAPRRLNSSKAGKWQSKKTAQPFQYPVSKRPPSRGSYGDERTMASRTYADQTRSSYTPDSFDMMSKSYAKGSRPNTPQTYAEAGRPYTPLSYSSKSFELA